MKKPPKVLAPQTPLSTPSPTPADERRSALETERAMMRKYGGKGRASTVLTGQGANSTLG